MPPTTRTHVYSSNPLESHSTVSSTTKCTSPTIVYKLCRTGKNYIRLTIHCIHRMYLSRILILSSQRKTLAHRATKNENMDSCRFEKDETQNRTLSNHHVCAPRMSYYCETCTATWLNIEDRGLKTYIASNTMFGSTVLGYADQAECPYTPMFGLLIST